MKALKIEEVSDFKSRKKNPGPKKSLFRKAMDIMKPGDALILDNGTDYTHYRLVYYAMKTVEDKTNYKFSLIESEDKTQVLIKCQL